MTTRQKRSAEQISQTGTECNRDIRTVRMLRSRKRSFGHSRLRPWVELLEMRRMLDADDLFYVPPQYHLFSSDGFLTGPAEGDAQSIALNYLNGHAADLGLTAADLTDVIISDQYVSEDTGISHIYLRQTAAGLEVDQADLNVHVSSTGEVISVAGGFVPGLAAQFSAGLGSLAPVVTAQEALLSAATSLGISLEGSTFSQVDEDGAYVLQAPALSLDDITPELHFVPAPDGTAKLAWELIVRTPDNEHWYDLGIDATTGELVSQSDWASDASYTVLPIPTESPNFGPFQVIVDPHLAATNASPFGWHDTNGLTGHEFTDTRGNNVDAHLDRDGNNIADVGGRPDGGPGLNFNFPFNPTLTPQQNANAAVTNLFYWNNVLHDVHYQYGFTSAAGNFQTNAYGLGGLGNDAVQADAQDNAQFGAANNANFLTPPDGSAPRMQMFEFTFTSPRRDSDMDPGIIIHEYGHGVSNRLTGGPANSNALTALQSGGMGEGWSDWWSLMLTQQSAIETTAGRGMGTYVFGQTTTGLGVRQFRYDFDIGNQSFETFLNFGGGINQSTQVHAVGTRWAATLWDLTHLLIQKYGFDPNVYNSASSAGNIRAMHLVMNALKLQPANPSFIAARDAILNADTVLHGGANHLEIWTAFARRGLGFGAFTSSSSSSILTTSFALPPQFSGLTITSTNPANNSIVFTQPTTYVINFSQALNPITVNPTDLLVNGIPANNVVLSNANQTATFLYNVSPVVNNGVQMMSVPANAVLRASDGDGNDLFTATFRYDALLLQVVSTNPPLAGGVFVLPAPLTYDVNFNEQINPSSVQTTDLILSGMPGAAVSGANVLPGNTTARFTITGITTEGTLAASIPAGAILDSSSNPGGAFSASYQVDIGTTPYPVPLLMKPPLGSLVYDPNAGGAISFAGDTDSFTLELDPGQTVSVLVAPVGTLAPTIQLRDPLNVLLGSDSAASSSSALLQTVATTVGGTYTVTIGGNGASTGSYTVQIVLNAALELEGNVTGAGNETLPTAQNIDAAFLNPGPVDSDARRVAVLGQIAGTTSTANLINNGTFETGNFNGWTVSFVGPNGWVINNGTYNPASPANPLPPISGLFDALTDPFGGGIRTLTQSFVVPSTVAQATLSWSDRIQNFANAFQDPNQEFRVQILDSLGTVLQTVFSTNPGDPLIQIGPNNRTADVTALLQSRVGQTLQLRFQEQDNLFYFNVTLDNISLNVQSAPPSADVDLYSMNLAAGDRVTLGIEALAGSGTSIQLLNSGGSVIATGAAGPANFDRVISNFAVTSSGLYYARVSGSAATYNLFATRNAAFDTESNDSFSTPQDITALSGALGGITAGSVGGAAVVPNNLANLEGIADNAWPFHIGALGQSSMRYQQIYSASQFAAGGNIDEIRFRKSAGQLNFSTTGIDVKINLSYASTSVATASAIFTNNIGPGAITVFDGLLSLSSTGAGAPSPFDIVIDVADSFHYEPSLGDLLVDVFMRSSPFTAFFDAAPVNQQTSMQRIFSFPGNVNATTGFVGTNTADPSPFGLVTQFTFAAQASNEDWYSINVTDIANALQLQTSTPASGPGEFVNNLNPRIELYSPSNVLVAVGTVSGDGRNESIQYTPSVPGNYRVRVTREGDTQGEYFLSKNFKPVVTDVMVTSAINENDIAVLNGTISDPDSRDSHTVVINWGPGEGTTTVHLTPGITTFTASHPYLDDNPTGTPSDTYPISIVVTDNHGATGTISSSGPTINELIVNGGFETGFAGWTVVNSGNGAWSLNDGTLDPLSPALPLPPISGNFDVVTNQSAPGSHILSEAFVVPSNITSAIVSWSDRIRNYGATFSDPNQEWRVRLMGVAGPIQELFSTNPGDPLQQVGPNNRTFDITSLLQSMAGQSIQLSFEEQDNLGFFNVTLDNVSLQVTTEVPSVLPVVTVSNVPPSSTALNLASSIDENGFVTVNGSFVDPGTLDTHTVVIDWGGTEGTTTVNLGPGVLTFTATHQYLDDNPSGTASDSYTISATVTDDDTGIAAASTILTVDNVAPANVALVLSASSIDENGSVTVDGTFADPGALDSHTVVIDWGGAEGTTTVNLAPGVLTFSASHQYSDDAPSGSASDPYTISATVTDDDTGSAGATAALIVNNLDPTILSITNDAPECGNTDENDLVTVSASFSDIGTLDTHSALIDWGDGTTTVGNVTESNGSGVITGSHAYTAGGVYTVVVTLLDDDTGSATATTTTTVSGVGVVGDRLFIIGTSSTDLVHVNLVGDQVVRVHASFLPGAGFRDIPAAGIANIKMLMCDGNDHVTVSGSVGLPAIIDGGSGDDHLNGGGASVILGGEGNDFLLGGNGRDILIGGVGADQLNGNSSDDILIGGTTDFDDNDEAMLALLAEWTSSRSLADREINIRNGIGAILDGTGYKLSKGESVFDDGLEDVLNGAFGTDWLFYDLDEDKFQGKDEISN